MKHRRPGKFDYNLAVLGAGSAGLVSAYIGAAVQARVALIESGKMGGDCLNTGCVPSKALIAAAKHFHHARNGGQFGIHCDNAMVDFTRVMTRVREAITQIEPNDSVERYRALGVDCISGHGMLLDPWTIRVGERSISAKNIILATGAEPAIPPIPGLDDIDYLTSNNLWELQSLPRRLAILGGGPIGCELAQAFARLGSDITVVEMQDRLLGSEDEDVGTILRAELEKEGVRVLTDTRATQVQDGSLLVEQPHQRLEIGFDQLLVATGRKPRTNGLGLENIGLEFEPHRPLAVNGFLQTNHPHIFACGDLTGPYQFTHAASHQAWHAVVNALFRPFKKFRVDYSHLPWTVYTEPEIARVGLNEGEAKNRDIAYEVTRVEFSELDRAITEGQTGGFIKLLTVPGRDRLLGATVVGSNAGEMIVTLTMAMKFNIGLNRLLGLIVPYPGWNEGIKRAAGSWKRSHAPAWIMPWLQRYHRWNRK